MNATELTQENMLPLLRESLRPFELFLGLVVRDGSVENLLTTTEIMAGLLAHAKGMMDARGELEGSLH